MIFDWHLRRVAVVVALLVAVTRAANADPKAEARARLDEGSTLYRRGDFEGALRKFSEARTLFPSPKIYFNLGQAHARLGHAAAAVDAFERFLAEATDAPLDRRQDAERLLAEQRPRVGFLRVDADAGSAISVDGQPAGTAPLPRPVPLDPGPHEITSRAPGAPIGHIGRVTIAVGQTAEWQAVAAPPWPAAPATALARPPAQAALTPVPAALDLTTRVPSEKDTPLYRRWWPWAIGAAAVASIAAALLIQREGALPTGSLGAADERTRP